MSKSTFLSTTTEHAMRALVCLAELPPGDAIIGARLAKISAIPENYMSKVLVTLRNAGFVRAMRGQHGGYQLAKPAREIVLFDVVKLFEGVDCEPECLLGEDHSCCDELACGAHDRWKAVVAVYLDFLRNTTISDLHKPERARVD